MVSVISRADHVSSAANPSFQFGLLSFRQTVQKSSFVLHEEGDFHIFRTVLPVTRQQVAFRYRRTQSEESGKRCYGVCVLSRMDATVIITRDSLRTKCDINERLTEQRIPIGREMGTKKPLQREDPAPRKRLLDVETKIRCFSLE